LRKPQLARLLRSRSEGIFIAPFEQGEIGPENPSHPAYRRVRDQF
jgi:hypothetical protein